MVGRGGFYIFAMCYLLQLNKNISVVSNLVSEQKNGLDFFKFFQRYILIFKQ